MNTCAKCGAEFLEGASFCSSCGAAKAAPAPQEPIQVPPAPSAQPVPPPPAYTQPTYPQPPQPSQPPVYYYPQPVAMAYPPDPVGESSAITCFVLGLISFFLCWFPVVTIVLSIIGITKFKRGKDTNKRTMAIIGLVGCIIGLVVSSIYTLTVLAGIIAFLASGPASYGWTRY